MPFYLIVDSIIQGKYDTHEDANLAKEKIIETIRESLASREIFIEETSPDSLKIKSRSLGYMYNGQIKLNHTVAIFEIVEPSIITKDAETQTDAPSRRSVKLQTSTAFSGATGATERAYAHLEGARMLGDFSCGMGI